MGRIRRVRIGIFLNVGIGIVFIIAAVIVVATVNYSMRRQALMEAQSKAGIILDRNLATHAYFSRIMKPSIFAWSEPFRSKEYFDRTWMSSTYAIREIEKYFKSFNPSGYSSKDAALDARSPENEADEYERAFLEKLAIDKKLESASTVRTIGGAPYLVVLRKGEVMESACLRCHSNPKDAPKGLTDYYGSNRSFNRKAGDVASAVSLRVPLTEAYAAANIFSMKLSAILLIVLACLFTIQYRLYRRYVLAPLNVLRDKANEIAAHEEHLGEQIPQPFGRELSEVTDTFNKISVKLRHDRDNLEDIVDKRTGELQDSEERYRIMIETVNESVIVAQDGLFKFVNPATITMMGGYSEQELVNKPFHEFIHPEDRSMVVENYRRRIENEAAPSQYTFRVVTRDGIVRWVEINAVLIKWLGKPATLNFLTDITARKQAEEQIKASLLEKETMLKEIHHRVKNNLQVISSLLDLQSFYLQDEKAKKIFQNSIDRVNAMAKIHTMLYQSEHLVGVDFGGFIKDLDGRLQQAYRTAGSPIEIHTNAVDVFLPIEISIPCGLILNELVSNALKHAFPEGRGGEVNISITTSGDRFTLTVQDNGIGFPRSIDFRNSQSLGLELVNLLVGQINGAVDLQVEGGTTFTVTFTVTAEESVKRDP